MYTCVYTYGTIPGPLLFMNNTCKHTEGQQNPQTIRLKYGQRN